MDDGATRPCAGGHAGHLQRIVQRALAGICHHRVLGLESVLTGEPVKVRDVLERAASVSFRQGKRPIGLSLIAGIESDRWPCPGAG